MRMKCFVWLAATSLLMSSFIVPQQNVLAAGKGETTNKVELASKDYIAVTSSKDENVKTNVNQEVKKKICLAEVLNYFWRVGETRQLHVNCQPKDSVDKEVFWTSSDENVVIVNEKGQITSVGNGTAVVTVALKSDPSITASCKIIVNVQSKGEKLVVCPVLSTFNKIGDSSKLTLCKGSATMDNSEVIWSSSNESVATVDEQGTVTSVGAGMAIITVTSKTKPALKTQCVVLVRIDGKCGCGCQ